MKMPFCYFYLLYFLNRASMKLVNVITSNPLLDDPSFGQFRRFSGLRHSLVFQLLH